MLAYNPIQHLLLGLVGEEAGPAVLVMTSANIGGEPILYSDNDLERLGDLADGVLTHNRPILMPCDDSVMRIVGSGRQLLRRSRGYAPLPVTAPFDVPPTLAVGADLKNTFCLAEDGYVWPSQHIGDMGDLAVIDSFAASESHFESITGWCRTRSPVTSIRGIARPRGLAVVVVTDRCASSGITTHMWLP